MKKNRSNEGQRWFKQAEYDLSVANNLVELQFHAAACFHAHQAAEKFLKALLYAQGRRQVIGHSIVELCDQCARSKSTFKNIKESVKTLDLYYIPTRYPNGLPGGVPAEMYEETDSAKALEMASIVKDAVLQAAPGLADDTAENDT